MFGKHAIVEGRVQGVFFRDFTRRQAQKLQVNGWVRNLPDGRVEAVFTGAEEDVTKMVKWLYTGSPHSSVISVECSDYSGSEDFRDFQIRY